MTLKDMLDAGLTLREYPEPVLRRQCVPVKAVDDDIRRLAAAMFEVMYDYRGIGLAAPQVGVPLRMFVANPTGEREKKDQELVFINPRYDMAAGRTQVGEGCLSLMVMASAELPVIRHAGIQVAATGLDGAEFKLKLSMHDKRLGTLCHVFQHEYDHLDGILYIDKVPAEAGEWIRGMLGYMEAQFDWKVNRIHKSPPIDELAAQVDRFLEAYLDPPANILVEKQASGKVADAEDTQGGQRGRRDQGSPGQPGHRPGGGGGEGQAADGEVRERGDGGVGDGTCEPAGDPPGVGGAAEGRSEEDGQLAGGDLRGVADQLPAGGECDGADSPASG